MLPYEVRVEQLWNDIEHRARTNGWLAQALLEDGSVCNTSSLPRDLREVANRVIDTIEPQPRGCWVNAREASMAEEFEYVEGLVLVGDYPPFEHAWVELDGLVVELTWRERPNPPEDSIYIGTKYTSADIKKANKQNRYSSWIAVQCRDDFVAVS